jgi:CSLREA domain-containing protein
MKSHQSKLSSFTRLQISKWLSIAIVLSLFLPAATLAKSRGHVSRSKPRSSINASAPLTTVIEVNTTNDGDNLDPSVGCDTEPGIPGDQCSLRAAIQRAGTLNGDGEIRFNIPSTEFNCNSGLCIINLTRTLPTLDTNVRIMGPGANKLWVRRTGADYRIFTVTATEVTLSGLKIDSGRPAGTSSGGALVNSGYGNVNIVDCVLSNNAAGATGGFGGAISHEGQA